MNTTSIEWTDATWNPVTGCSKVSQGCKFCYAERVFSRPYPGRNFIDVLTHPDRLDWPLRWKGSPKARAERRPSRIFVNSMSDLFHEKVPFEFIDRLFAVMALADNHTFQVLTKRPARMLEYFRSCGPRAMDSTEARVARCAEEIARRRGEDIEGAYSDVFLEQPYRNVWLGVSVENQATADERIPLLLQTPASVRFASYEPALGPVDFTRCVQPSDEDWYRVNELEDENNVCEPEPFIEECEAECDWINFGDDMVENPEYPEWVQWRKRRSLYFALGRSIDWVIAGGESGPHARPAHPDWFRSVRDQCQTARVPFFFKQWGEYLPAGQDGKKSEGQPQEINSSDKPIRVGKRKAGRLLDGEEWNQFPERR